MRHSMAISVVLSLFLLSGQQVQAQLLGGLVPALCACPAGTICAVVLGCAPCPAGYSSNEGSTSCWQCPPNSYSSEGGLCYYCPAGTESQAGSASCQACPAGTISGPRGGGCRRCPAGSTSGVGASECTACSAGTFSDPNTGTCRSCPAGTYQDQGGQESCKPCSEGSFQSQTGRTTCDTCPCGTFSDKTGSTECTSCPGSKPVSSPGSPSSSECSATSPGSTLDSNGCLASCPSGSYLNNQPAGTKTCTQCPSGQVAESGSTSCQTCRIGTAPDSTQATCTPTSTARMNQRSKIPICPTGHAACPVGRRGILECVDISSHLTSCGGCPGSGEGVDCTIGDPMASAACVGGRCQYECPRGYRMTAQGCKRRKRP